MATAIHSHLSTLRKTVVSHQSQDGKAIDVYEVDFGSLDEAILSNWAKTFREHYCLDAEIDDLRDGTGLSRRDYLLNEIFPSTNTRLGPAVRSGDFCEILVSDVLETLHGYWVPRTRYSMKSTPDESPHGTDVIAFRLTRSDGSWSNDDVLFVGEAKAQASHGKPKPRLQDAVDDSAKDYHLRKSASLNAAKRRLLQQNKKLEAARVERFQDENARPYKRSFGAIAIFTASAFCSATIQKTTCEKYPSPGELSLLVITAMDLMQFVHAIYERAADEA